MKSNYRITQISSNPEGGIHTYYDICPESPDGSRVLYCKFDKNDSGKGRIIVVNKDGSEPDCIDEVFGVNMHSGVFQQWIDNSTVVFQSFVNSRSKTIVYSLDSGVMFEIPARVRMFSSENNLCLCEIKDSPSEQLSGKGNSICVSNIKTQAIKTVFELQDAINLYPHKEMLKHADMDSLYFKHEKWSIDGTKFLFVFTDESVNSVTGLRRNHIKGLFVMTSDGTDARYLGEFGHHPYWGIDSSYAFANCNRFMGKRCENGNMIVKYPVDGTEPSILFEGVIIGIHPSFSPDGSKMIGDPFEFPEPHYRGLSIYDVESGSTEMLAVMPYTNQWSKSHPHPVWSRDGKRIYFNSSHTGVPHLYALDL